MDAPDRDAPMVINRRSWCSIRSRWLFFLVVNALGVVSVGVFLEGWFESGAIRANAESQLWRIWAIPSVCLAVSLIPFVIPSGYWLVDDVGIEWAPPIGKARRLEWLEVDRVLWLPDRVVLRGNKRSLGFRRPTFGGGIDRRVFDRIAANLLPNFDLGPVKLWYHRQEWKRMRLDHPRMAALLFAGLVIWTLIGVSLLGWFWMIAQSQSPGRTDAVRLVGILTILLFGWMAALLLPVALRLQRPLLVAVRTIHPEYPWRLRKAKTGIEMSS